MEIEKYYKQLMERETLDTRGIKANVIYGIVQMCIDTNILCEDNITDSMLYIVRNRGVIYV